MKNLIIKLGGSVITDKQHQVAVARKHVLRQLCQEIADFKAANRTTNLIILHGAGSFGHPLAHQYQLNGGKLNAKRVFGLSKTTVSLRELTNLVTQTLQRHNLPAFPVQTNCLFYADPERNIKLAAKTVLEKILRSGGIPVLGGDTLITDDQHAIIASADTLAVILAQRLKSKRVIFTTNVDGVFSVFPPSKNDRPLAQVSRHQLSQFISTATRDTSTKTDVTGAMIGKLRALLPLQNIQVNIINGLRPGNLSQVLTENQFGTTIQL